MAGTVRKPQCSGDFRKRKQRQKQQKDKRMKKNSGRNEGQLRPGLARFFSMFAKTSSLSSL
jgi:hypothetical protein